jgi:hypothetical protein
MVEVEELSATTEGGLALTADAVALTVQTVKFPVAVQVTVVVSLVSGSSTVSLRPSYRHGEPV